MPETKSKSSYSVYTCDSYREKIEDNDEYSWSQAVDEALSEWIPENIDN